MPCWIATLLSKFGPVFWHDPLCFQCREISKRCEVVNGNFFAEQWYQYPIPIDTDFFFLSCYLNLILISLPVLYFPVSFLWCTFTFVGQFPLSTIQFYYKMSHDIPQRQKGNKLCPLLSVHELNEQILSDQSWQTLKEAPRWAVDRDGRILFTKRLVDWRANSKICSSCNYSHLIYYGNWNWMCPWGTGII